VVSLTSGPGTPFKATAQAHPGTIDVAHAERISIPVCMLASADEDAAAVRAWEGAVRGPARVEIFGDQIHGWMSARGDLGDDRVRAEYERGYGIFLEFFAQYL
jgi:dienelactone hydrolase